MNVVEVDSFSQGLLVATYKQSEYNAAFFSSTDRFICVASVLLLAISKCHRRIVQSAETRTDCAEALPDGRCIRL